MSHAAEIRGDRRARRIHWRGAARGTQRRAGHSNDRQLYRIEAVPGTPAAQATPVARARPGRQLVVRRVADLLAASARGPAPRGRGIADAGREDVRRPVRGSRPSPTASRAPTSARTIEWQKASASTVASATPRPGVRLLAPPREAEQAPDRRRALAPLAEGGEVVLAERGPPRRRSARRGRADAASQSVSWRRSGSGTGVVDAVGVAPRQGREPGVEAGRGRAHRADRARRPAAPRRGGAAGASGSTAARQVDVRDLPGACTPASVRPAHDQPSGLAEPQHRERRLERRPARCARPGCRGPAGELGAVVGEVEAARCRPGRSASTRSRANADEPAVPVGRGRRARRRRPRGQRCPRRLAGIVGVLRRCLGGLAGELAAVTPDASPAAFSVGSRRSRCRCRPRSGRRPARRPASPARRSSPPAFGDAPRRSATAAAVGDSAASVLCRLPRCGRSADGSRRTACRARARPRRRPSAPR